MSEQEIRKQEALRAITRRHFFREAGCGIGKIALGSLLCESLFGALAVEAQPANPLAARPTHFAPKAKRIIYLFMAGAPSQLDLFDYKPKLVEYNNKPCPAELLKGERFAFIKGVPKLLGTPHQFARHGRSGQEISNLLPHLAGIADEIAIVRSMQTEQFNHAPAQIYMNSGHQLPGRPSMGAW